MTKYWKIGIITGLLVLLAYFNWSVFQKEQVLKNGTFVLLKLAPVDPRSLIQGDYMSLRYECVDSIRYPRESSIMIELDSNHVGTKVNKYSSDLSGVDLSGVVTLRCKGGKYGRVHIGAESYFFEEGQAELFEKACYGGLMVDKKGNSILVGLYDENLEKIKK